MQLKHISLLATLMVASSIQFTEAVTPPDGLAQAIVGRLQGVCSQHNSPEALKKAIGDFNSRDHQGNHASIWKGVLPTELKDDSTGNMVNFYIKEGDHNITCRTLQEYNYDTNRNMNWGGVSSNDGRLMRFELKYV